MKVGVSAMGAVVVGVGGGCFFGGMGMMVAVLQNPEANLITLFISCCYFA